MHRRISSTLLVSLALASALVSLAATSTPSLTISVQDPPRVQALNAWKAHLERINWPQDLRDRMAPKLLGKLSKVEDNGNGNKTYTFDGSQPGMLATVTLKLDASGTAVASPVVTFADIVEAR